MSEPEHIGDVLQRVVKRLRDEVVAQFGEPCDCGANEIPVNPERRCTQCGRFIWFCGDDDGWLDYWDWRGLGDDTSTLIEQQLTDNARLKIPEEKRVRRCLACWKGVGCVCETPSYLEGGTR